MKRVFTFLLIAAMLPSLAACNTAPATEGVTNALVSQQPASATTETPDPAERPESATAPASETSGVGHILIAFFSRADENYGVGYIEKGNTHVIAEMIAEETGGTLFHIERDTPYPDTYDACTDEAKAEQNSNARPALKEDIDVSDYDVIFLGYPIWWGDMPMPVYTFLEGHDFTGKTVIPFCTHGGSGLSGTVSSIKNITEATVLEGLAIPGTTAQNEQEEAKAKVIDWLKESGFGARDTMLAIQIGNATLTATLADNSSAEGLRELLAAGPLTIHMSDYGGFEKVGELGTTLPRNDESITTEPGDLILYQGNRFVIYYDTNTWAFTRLGKIEGVTAQELRAILGEGDVTAILSLADGQGGGA